MSPCLPPHSDVKEPFRFIADAAVWRWLTLEPPVTSWPWTCVSHFFFFYTTNQTAYSPERGAEPRAPRRPDFTGCRGPTRYSPLLHKHGLQYTHTRSMKTPWDGGISPEQSKQNSSDSILCITLREKTYIFRRTKPVIYFQTLVSPEAKRVKMNDVTPRGTTILCSPQELP